jgi:hypothetical protein
MAHDPLASFLIDNDPGRDVSLARLGRVETRLLEQIAATPQGILLRVPEETFQGLVVPLWKSSLFAVLLLVLGIYVGSLLPVRSAVSQTAAESGPRVTVFAMVAPWQALVEQ